ncbi:MAG: histidine phosphatase family protein [Synergistaceae bacterium]|nr:histidine phosphatase family protein [Synergistaceae bacterium]
MPERIENAPQGTARRRIVLARHGQTEWNQERRFQGKTDIPLNDVGMAQAHALAVRLSRWPVEAVYSSPLSRALYTATAIAERHHLDPVVLTELHEVDFADWEGQSIAALSEDRGEEFSRWWEDPFFNPPLGAETWEEIETRLSRATRRILAGPEREILIVSHGGITRALYAVLAGMDPHKVWNVDVSNCAISGVEIRMGRPRLAFANDDLHIRAGKAGRTLPVW